MRVEELIVNKRKRKIDFFFQCKIEFYFTHEHQNLYLHKCFWCSFGEIKLDFTLKKSKILYLNRKKKTVADDVRCLYENFQSNPNTRIGYFLGQNLDCCYRKMPKMGIIFQKVPSSDCLIYLGVKVDFLYQQSNVLKGLTKLVSN